MCREQTRCSETAWVDGRSFTYSASLAQRKPTFGPASSADPQLRDVVRLIEGGESHPPPRSTCAAPDRGEGPVPSDSTYQSSVHSSTLPLKSITPKMLAPPGCDPTRAGRGWQLFPLCSLSRVIAFVHEGPVPHGKDVGKVLRAAYLPLSLGGQALVREVAVRVGVLPVHARHRELRIARVVRARRARARRLGARAGVDARAVRTDADLGAVDPEGRDRERVRRSLVGGGAQVGGAHREAAARETQHAVLRDDRLLHERRSLLRLLVGIVRVAAVGFVRLAVVARGRAGHRRHERVDRRLRDARGITGTRILRLSRAARQWWRLPR